eukprot:6490395-Amphidinium_carterae.3
MKDQKKHYMKDIKYYIRQTKSTTSSCPTTAATEDTADYLLSDITRVTRESTTRRREAMSKSRRILRGTNDTQL